MGIAAAGRHRPPWMRWVAALPVVVLLLVAGVSAAGVSAAHAQGRANAPESFADLAQKLLPAVVNISTTQNIPERRGAGPRPGPEMPQFPPGSPFEEFFRDFFVRQGREQNAPPRRATSLGSGFVVDAIGLVVTNNHVTQAADEINVILQDDTNLKAEVVGRDPKPALALLGVKTEKKLTAVSFG